MAALCSSVIENYSENLYPESLVVQEQRAFWLERHSTGKRLVLLAQADDRLLAQFDGQVEALQEGYVLLRCPANVAHAYALQTALPYLKAVPLGLETSVGFGDRLGLATPGHVQALRQASASPAARPVRPVFAQQSIREMARTGRSPHDILSDATWGAFQAGWRGPVGADADHLKTPEDIDRCIQAGFSLYTLDPGDYVDGSADQLESSAVQQKVQSLPWEVLESSPADLLQRFGGRSFDLDGQKLFVSQEVALRAAVKYGRAVANVVAMFRHLERQGLPFELEVSVDETETPTSHAEHYYVASELKRLGVGWVSLAPRFVGRFEKGVDYIGDQVDLAVDLNRHAGVARCLGPYKLSLHSGSDKFSVYPLLAEAARGLVHLKTAGTSYLEALRVIATLDAAFFRQILDYARERYDTDRASYHVSARLSQVPASQALADGDLPGLLEAFDAREVLHVTFGSVLNRFGARLKATLQADEPAYYTALQRHFVRHLGPFTGG